MASPHTPGTILHAINTPPMAPAAIPEDGSTSPASLAPASPVATPPMAHTPVYGADSPVPLVCDASFMVDTGPSPTSPGFSAAAAPALAPCTPPPPPSMQDLMVTVRGRLEAVEKAKNKADAAYTLAFSRCANLVADSAGAGPASSDFKDVNSLTSAALSASSFLVSEWALAAWDAMALAKKADEAAMATRAPSRPVRPARAAVGGVNLGNAKRVLQLDDEDLEDGEVVEETGTKRRCSGL